MPSPKPAWLPNGSTALEEIDRVSALTVAQLCAEHIELFAAHLNMLARVADAASGTRRHTWGRNIRRILHLGRALRSAIETGDEADRLRAKDNWDRPRQDMPAMFKNADQERANSERWNKSELISQHMKLWGAFKQSRAQKDAVQATGNPLKWTKLIRRARVLADAMRDAIDTGDLADCLEAVDNWAADQIDARDP